MIVLAEAYAESEVANTTNGACIVNFPAIQCAMVLPGEAISGGAKMV